MFHPFWSSHQHCLPQQQDIFTNAKRDQLTIKGHNASSTAFSSGMNRREKKSYQRLTRQERALIPSSISWKGFSSWTVVCRGSDDTLVMVSSLYCMVKTSSGCYTNKCQTKSQKAYLSWYGSPEADINSLYKYIKNKEHRKLQRLLFTQFT